VGFYNKNNMFLSQHYLYGENGTFSLVNLDSQIKNKPEMPAPIIAIFFIFGEVTN